MPLLLAAIGFFAGPALHHLAVRAGVWAPFSGGRPACEQCEHPLRLFGFGEVDCGACGKRRRWKRELLVSVGAAALFYAAGWLGGNPLVVLSRVLLAAVSVILFVTDLDHKLIPNRILYPGGAAAVLVLGVGAAIDGALRGWGRGLALGAAYFGLFYLVAVIARGGFGFGDVKLAALLGTFTGHISWPHFAMGVFLTGLIGGIPAILLLVTRRAGVKHELPYGPAMILGCWGSLLFGTRLILGL